MKNLLRLISISLLTSFTILSACKDDEDPNPLIGTWIFVSETISECDDSSFNGTETCDTSCDQIVITATTISGDGITLNYTLDGNKIITNIGGIPLPGASTYVISGNQLTITDDTDDVFGCKTVTVYKKG